jgi:hypothetical protein
MTSFKKGQVKVWGSTFVKLKKTNFLLFLRKGSASSLLSGDADDGCYWKSRLLSAGFHTGAHHRRRVAEGGLHL